MLRLPHEAQGCCACPHGMGKGMSEECRSARIRQVWIRLSAVVCVMAIASLCLGCAFVSPTSAGGGSGAGGGSAAHTSVRGDVTVPTYTPYDPSEFNTLCDELLELSSGQDAQAVIDHYDRIYAELEHIEDLGTAAYHAHGAHIADESRSQQLEDHDAMADECFVAAQEAIAAACKGPCADALKAHVGEDVFEGLASYKPVGDRELSLATRETELVNDYYAALEKADDGDRTDAEINAVVGPIFLELVDVRTEIAKLYGYDSYADYADQELYWRDYEARDLEKLYSAVKEISPRYFDLYYNSDAASALYMDEYPMSCDEILEHAAAHADEVDPLVAEALSFLRANHLYDIDGSRSRMAGGFTDLFLADRIPFIYIDLDGQTDFQTLTHELGHFIDFYQTPTPNFLAYGFGGNNDLSEIQSNGLQALYMHFYDDVFNEEMARDARDATLMELLGGVVDGCIFDEFQREVYRHPNMTLDEVNQLYRAIAAEYGDLATGPHDYWWQYISHTFESPLYYVSYATSGLVALQIWDQSQTDFDAACDTWRSFIDAGTYDKGYLELLDELGLADFRDRSAVVGLCTDVLDFIEHS